MSEVLDKNAGGQLPALSSSSQRLKLRGIAEGLAKKHNHNLKPEGAMVVLGESAAPVPARRTMTLAEMARKTTTVVRKPLTESRPAPSKVGSIAGALSALRRR